MVENINNRVLHFYRECAFNTYSSAQEASKNILEANQVQQAYLDLHEILLKPEILSFVDVGCGGGWLANSISHYYTVNVTGVDFNENALQTARDVAQAVNSEAQFVCCNLFEVEQLKQNFDVVCSIGVLHHTADPYLGLQKVSDLLSDKSKARLYIGLYHLYGRRPFLEYFEQMKTNGKDEEAMFDAFSELHQNLTDKQHLKSWFRDQVIHPHETQHSLKEVAKWLNQFGFAIESTSINKYQPILDLDSLFEQEKEYEKLSYMRNFEEKRYFPGFFTVCAKRL